MQYDTPLSSPIEKGALKVKGQVKERWLELCEQIAKEEDTTRLLELTREQILEEKQKRLQSKTQYDR
jgi:hypothetical protein